MERFYCEKVYMTSIVVSDLVRLVTSCGNYAKQQRHQLAVTRKSDGSLVTNIDQAVEAQIVSYLRTNFPTHAILGEEGTFVGDQNLASHEFLWVIAPIDGTSAFAGGLTGWCVGIGLVHYGKPYAGFVYAPMSEELYVATPDGQALRNEQPIHVSTTPTIQLDDWMAVPSDLHRKYTINYHGRVRTTGATIMSMCYVAAGMASAALIGSCKAWDIAPALALVHNAGAELWGLDGQIVDISTMLHPDAKTPTMICAPQEQFQQYRDTIVKIEN